MSHTRRFEADHALTTRLADLVMFWFNVPWIHKNFNLRLIMRSISKFAASGRCGAFYWRSDRRRSARSLLMGLASIESGYSGSADIKHARAHGLFKSDADARC